VKPAVIGSFVRQSKSLDNVVYGMDLQQVACRISSAPFDREIELAIIDDEFGLVGFSCPAMATGWLDQATLQPVKVTATHWRYLRASTCLHLAP
jgi:hypothetical protein